LDYRNVDLTVETGTWTGTPTTEVVTLSSKTSVSLSIDIALLITALVTRPPEVYGFSLADAWAWLRYRPAFSYTADLRLKTEWEDIDPHQKTILSDEVGMGFTVYLCAEELDFTIIANTQYFLRVVTPKGFYLGRSQKNGPRKSPDFVALDSQGRVNVLECKGTQQSRKALQTLIESGVQQKSNLKTRAGSAVHHSLVVGLFVPQFSNKEEALLHVRDPNLPLVEDILKQITVAQQTIGITQIALAQHFGLMGLQSMANALANRAVIENEPLQLAHRLEAEAVQSGQDPIYTFRFSLPLPTGAMTLNDREVSRINFEMSCFKDLYTELISSTDLNTTLLKLANAAYQSKWASKRTKDTATLMSPLGFTLNLSYVLSTLPSNQSSRRS
jgi:hypothetical protein